MKLATSTGDFSKYTESQNESIKYIKQSGFEYIDYNFHVDYVNKSGVFTDDWKNHIDNIKRTADELDVKFVQAHAPMGAPIADGNEEFIEVNKRCIESCARLGINNIVIHSGYIKYISKEETIEKNKEFYNKLLPLAEEKGINILTENFDKMSIENFYWIDNAFDMLELIEYVDHPFFHAVWDTGHANMHEIPQDECLRLLGKHVYALHVQDNFGDSDAHIPPFWGTMNLDSLMHGLNDINYNGYFTFEAPNIFAPETKRRPYSNDERLLKPSLELRIEAEKFLYKIGKHILTAYECFEG